MNCLLLLKTFNTFQQHLKRGRFVEPIVILFVFFPQNVNDGNDNSFPQQCFFFFFFLNIVFSKPFLRRILEWHKKTYTSKITNFFQKQNCEAQSSILICSLWFLSPKVDSPMALPHIWRLVRKHNIFILIFFSINPWYKYTFEHDSIRYYVCLVHSTVEKIRSSCPQTFCK